MVADDLKTHAVDASQDFYDLLGIQESALESEIRTAYRKTALKYHPDKVGANPEALDKFHGLQIAYDVLSDETLKSLYDNARRAKAAQKARAAALDGHRKKLKDDLEARESAAQKRKRGEVDEGDSSDAQEARRLAEDGRRRREELIERRRKEALEAEERHKNRYNQEPSTSTTTTAAVVNDMDLCVSFRFPKNDDTMSIDRAEVERRFSQFGENKVLPLREKKFKIEGEKHRKVFVTGVIMFTRVIGAHAAVSGFEKLRLQDARLQIFDDVRWTAGKEPQCIPKGGVHNAKAESLPLNLSTSPRSTQGTNKTPAFSSSHIGSTSHEANALSPDDILTMRMKNAQRLREQRQRDQEKIRAEAETNQDGSVQTPPVPDTLSNVHSLGNRIATLSNLEHEHEREQERLRLIDQIRQEDARADEEERSRQG